MIDNPYIVKCIDKIKEKHGEDDVRQWTDRDFKALSERIYELSGVMISVLTLKRLFGKIPTISSYSPQEATKDALAKYIGYSNWSAYINSFSENQEPAPVEKKKTTLPSFVYLVITIVLLVLILFYFLKRNKEIVFNATDTVGYAPHTATFHYDIRNMGKKPVFIDFDDGQLIRLPVENSFIKHGYLIPYYFNVHLQSENKQLTGNKNIHVLSKEWEARISYVKQEPTLIQLVPADTAFLYVNPQEIKEKGYDKTKGYYFIDYRYFQDFPVEGDRLHFRARFLNNQHTGGLFGKDVNFCLLFENSLISWEFLAPGNEGVPKIIIGDKTIDAQFTDLSPFNIAMEDWQETELYVVNNKMEIYLNEKKIFSEEVMQTLGKVKGIIISTLGSGAIDDLMIRDQLTDSAYKEKFN